MAESTSVAEDPTRLDGPLRTLLIAVVVGSFLSVLDMTIVNVALRDLSERLGGSVASIQWVVTGYMLALAVSVPLTGWTARRFGTRRMYLGNLVLFTVASLLCGLAWSTGSLIAFRVLQGLAGGAILPLAQMIVARECGPLRMRRGMAVLGGVTVLAPVLGPIIGGLIVDNVSWRWIFFINIPLGLAGLGLAWWKVPRDTPQGIEPMDWPGLVLLVLGLPAFTYAVSELGQGVDPAAFRAVPLLLISVVLLATFVWHALRESHPLLNLRLMSNDIYGAAATASFFLGAALFGPYLLMPLFFQEVTGASALGAGALFATQGIGAWTAIRIGGALSDRVSGGAMITFGTLIVTAMCIPMTQFTENTPYPVAILVLVLRGFGYGFALLPAIATALGALERPQLPDGTALLNVLQRIGGSIATAVIAVLLAHELSVNPDTAAGAATAYAHTNWLVVAIAILPLPSSLWLMHLQRRPRPPEHEVGPFADAAADTRPVSVVE